MLELEAEPGPSRRTAHELVRDTLRRAILRGTLPGGTRLVQADIAVRLEVSTTPVREALRDLATEGLIRLDAHRGAVVQQLELSEVTEIYDLRMLLEPEGMRRATRSITPDGLQRAELVSERMSAEQDAGTWADMNREFHGLLVEGIDSPRLKSILRNLRDSAAPYVGFSLQEWGAEQIEAANEEHRELIAAMRAGDEERAAAVTEQHLKATVQALERARAALESDPDGGSAGS